MSVNPRIRDVVRQEWAKKPRARKSKHRDTGPTADVQAIVRGRAKGRCERCAWPVPPNADIHHRIPRGMGGTRDPRVNLPSNLVVLCRSCHMWVESRRADATDLGWLVLRSEDPAAKPIPSALHGRVLLPNDDGEPVLALIEGGAA